MFIGGRFELDKKNMVDLRIMLGDQCSVADVWTSI